MKALKKWVFEVRGNDDCPFMFISKRGGEISQISKTQFNHWFANEFSKIVGRRIFPHILRSSRVSQLVIEDGKSIKAAQAICGHENIRTTEIYLVREGNDDLDDVYIS